MATTTPFGSDREDKSSTPSKSDETARDSASVAPDEKVDAPSKVDKGVWEQAEAAWRNQSGGGHGVSEEGKKDQIQKFYDQMVENDKQTKAWEGKE